MRRPSKPAAPSAADRSRPARLRRSAAWACAVSLLLAAPAVAQQDGEPLRPGEFNIDLVIGPVLGTGRAVGLGGAYAALATGVDGAPWNPASFASRELWAVEWLEWDVSFGLIPGTLRNTDFDNNGESGFVYDDFTFLTLGLALQLGELGLGGSLTTQSYQVGGGGNLSLAIGDYGLGYTFAQGQIVVGAALRTISLTIDESMGQPLVEFGGTAPEAGMLLRIADQPWRLGFAARMPVESDGAAMPVASGFNLPDRVRMPWDLQLGFAWQFGPRPLNRLWVNPNDERDRLHEEMMQARRERLREQLTREALENRVRMAGQTGPPRLPYEGGADTPRYPEGAPQDPRWWAEEQERRWAEEQEMLAQLSEARDARRAELRALSRRYLLVSTGVIFVGPTENGVGIESFLSQVRQTAGETISVGARLGLEGEPIENWVKMRVGTYLEPSRFDGVDHRVHGTLSTDVRLFAWDLFGLVEPVAFSLGTSADVAERYLNLGVSVGIWH
ncbi:MAG: hypothetical protein PVI30_15035 [Myxococcales bacterium]